jgi:hypothetical protein
VPAFKADSSSEEDGGKGGTAAPHGGMPNQALSPAEAWSMGYGPQNQRKNRSFRVF